MVVNAFVEYKAVYQPPRSTGRRRWFSDGKDMDLIVWYSDSGAVRGFQLCYDREGSPRAFTWHVEYGLTHNHLSVVRGAGTANASTVLSDRATGPVAELNAHFLERAVSLEKDIARLVCEKLGEYAQ